MKLAVSVGAATTVLLVAVVFGSFAEAHNNNNNNNNVRVSTAKHHTIVEQQERGAENDNLKHLRDHLGDYPTAAPYDADAYDEDYGYDFEEYPTSAPFDAPRSHGNKHERMGDYPTSAPYDADSYDEDYGYDFKEYPTSAPFDAPRSHETHHQRMDYPTSAPYDADSYDEDYGYDFEEYPTSAPFTAPRVHEKHVSSRCTDAAGWTDEYGDDCAAYASNTTWCEIWEDEEGTTSSGETLVVTEACCACKSGDSDSSPTDTSPSESPGSSPSPDSNAWLTAHNSRRAQYGKPAASWSSDLADQAKHWADYLIKKSSHKTDDCDLVHISNQCGDNVGENLATNWGSAAETPEEVLKGWTEDEMKVVASEGPDAALHATQVLWKSSTQIGCATSEGSCGAVSVCRYYKAGNYNCDNCVDAITNGTEEEDDSPFPVTAEVDNCNRNSLGDY